MKKLFSGIVVVLLVICVSGLQSCGGDEPLAKTDEVKQLLIGSGTNSKTWKIQSVLVDGVDKASIFSNMTIKFTETGFTTTGGAAVWPASGTWSFTNDEATAIKRNDGTEVQVTVTENNLKLTLIWSKNTFGLGRVDSISGQHIFSFGL